MNGFFSDKKPKKIDETIDLRNAFVLPPFGDAHNHTLELAYNFESFSNTLFSHGIFYLKNPNSVPRFTKQIAEKIAKPDTIDAVFANGGLTATGGHPGVMYNTALANGPFKFLKIADYENLAFYIVNDEKELGEKWGMILAEKPDFIKTYLLFSEEFEERRDKDVGGFKGLDPALLPLIVKKAHEAGLRVSTHVNTAYDFGVAVRAGVDEINHLPGRFSSGEEDFEKYILKESDVKLAGEKGIYVVPTFSLFLINKNSEKTYREKVVEIQKRHLNLLKKYGVRIAFGPDTYNNTSQLEAFYLKDLAVFSNLELIKMWSENTPQTIFPDRKIAKLKDGYEASFIVMPENPLKNFEAVKNINYRFKQGFPIEVKTEKGNQK
ncbi:MAG: amidohydrolase family protein [Pyrinomonadaceae bacterium]